MDNGTENVNIIDFPFKRKLLDTCMLLSTLFEALYFRGCNRVIVDEIQKLMSGDGSGEVQS